VGTKSPFVRATDLDLVLNLGSAVSTDGLCFKQMLASNNGIVVSTNIPSN
jgi:hypothetical protein